MNVLDLVTPTVARRPNFRLSLLDLPIVAPRRREPDAAKPQSKLLSLEVDLGGMAVEFKAKNLAGLLGWLALDATLAAVVQELMRPRQFRTWHGRVAGFIPYDLRRPTLGRVFGALWAPDNPRLFTDTALGVGWSLNLAQVWRMIQGSYRPARTAPYSGPKVAAS
ncbi:MAG TPA: DUF5808 domain-containing protein [Chloroflexota bacterium]